MINSILKSLIETLNKIPQISRKNAENISLFLLTNGKISNNLSEILNKSSNTIKNCSNCGNLSLDHLCKICKDDAREKIICIVSTIHELIKIEKSKSYRGKYHIIGGLIDPIKGIDEKRLNLHNLNKRLETEDIEEVIFALDPDIPGDLTSEYIKNNISNKKIKLSRIIRGVPSGGKIKLFDNQSISESIKYRKDILD
jgi:recombination protein RecR